MTGADHPAAEVGASAQRKGQCPLTQQQVPGPPAAQEEHRKLTPVSGRATPNAPCYITPSYNAQWKYCDTYYESSSILTPLGLHTFKNDVPCVDLSTETRGKKEKHLLTVRDELQLGH